MAKPVGFEGCNSILYAPESSSQEECGDLPIQIAEGQIISCWRLSVEEIEEIQRTGVVWLSIYGNVAPPVKVAAIGIFEDENPKAEPVMPRAPRERK